MPRRLPRPRRSAASSRRPTSNACCGRAAVRAQRSLRRAPPAGAARRPPRRRRSAGRPSYQQIDAPACAQPVDDSTRSPADRLARHRRAEAARAARRDAHRCSSARSAPPCSATPARLPPGLWVVRLRAPFDRAAVSERGVAGACARRARRTRRRCSQRRGRAAAPMSRRRAWPAAAPPADRRWCAATGLLLKPLARQRLPLRADLLAPTRSRPRAPRRRWPAATWRAAGCCAAIPGAQAAATRCPQRRRASSPPCSAAAAPIRLRSAFRHRSMTDIRRTLLWVVFIDVAVPALGRLEQAHRPALAVRRRRPRDRPRRRAAPGAERRPAGARRRAGAGAGRPPRRAGAPPRRGRRRRRPRRRADHVTTDLVKATLDSRGGTLVRARAAAAAVDHGRPDASNVRAVRPVAPSALYLARRPAWSPGRRRRPAEPPHADDARCRASARCAAAQNELQVRFESPPVGGVKLVKTYTFKRGDYVDRRASTRSSTSRRAPVTPQPVPAAGARRQRRRPASRASTSPSPARRSTPTASKFQKIDFKDIEKGSADQPDHDAPTTAGSRWCSTTSRRPG